MAADPDHCLNQQCDGNGSRMTIYHEARIKAASIDGEVWVAKSIATGQIDSVAIWTRPGRTSWDTYACSWIFFSADNKF